MSGDEELDVRALQNLQRLGGEPLVHKMIDYFSETGAARIARLLQAARDGDLSSVEQLAHLLKSNAGMVGAKRVQRLADQIEDLAVAGRACSLGGLSVELQDAFREVLPLLEQQRVGSIH